MYLNFAARVECSGRFSARPKRFENERLFCESLSGKILMWDFAGGRAREIRNRVRARDFALDVFARE
jgi:hypothetical protein